MVRTRIIGIISGKGGVGKTTLTFNLGTALADFGKNVMIIDGNLTTPNLGIHAGTPLYPTTLNDVLKGNVDIYDVMHVLPSGLKIVPASINLKDIKGVNPKKLSTCMNDLVGKLDFILIDGAPGLGSEALSVLNASHEILGVTTLDFPSLIDLLKTQKLIEEQNKNYLGSVVNMTRNKGYEPREHLNNFFENSPILETIPHDEQVRYALSKRMSVLHHKPNSKASVKIKSLASKLAGVEYQIPWYRKIFK